MTLPFLSTILVYNFTLNWKSTFKILLKFPRNFSLTKQRNKIYITNHTFGSFVGRIDIFTDTLADLVLFINILHSNNLRAPAQLYIIEHYVGQIMSAIRRFWYFCIPPPFWISIKKYFGQMIFLEKKDLKAKPFSSDITEIVFLAIHSFKVLFQ